MTIKLADTASASNREQKREHSSNDGMAYVPGGIFGMGSDKHCPEEAPVHRVTVDGFWMDRTPVANPQFKEFVRATDHVTVAEISPDPRDYPGTLPHMLYAGSLVFIPPLHEVNPQNWGEWWTCLRGARHATRHAEAIDTSTSHGGFRCIKRTISDPSE